MFVPGDLLNRLTDVVCDLLVQSTVLLDRVRALEASSSELLLCGVEALVEVVAVIVSCWGRHFGGAVWR